MSARRRLAVVNRDLLTATCVDSGALTILGAIVRRFPEPGTYLGLAERGESVSRFELAVAPGATAGQVDVDLARLGDDAPCIGVHPEGHVVFHVGSGGGGYAVRVARAEQGEVVFDSAQLAGEDVFAVTLIRPGTYSVRNLTTGDEGEVEVSYPERGSGRGGPQPPVEIECTEKGFEPARFTIAAAQGQVYRFRTPSRVAIELVQPNDGPHASEGPRGRRGMRPAAS